MKNMLIASVVFGSVLLSALAAEPAAMPPLKYKAPTQNLFKLNEKR